WLPVQNADANGRTPVIDLAEGEQWNLDAAWSAASIALAGTVWLDLNRNDLREPSEPLLDDVAVLLYRSDSVLASATTTGSDGQYAYSIVAPGSYFLVFLPQFYPVPIQPAYGLNAQGQSADFYLSPGQSQLLDVAFVPDSLLSGVGGDAQEEWPGLKIYPNPTRNMLWIEMPGGAAGMSWSLYNLVGQQIRDTERAEPLPDLETVGRLDVTNIPPGVYLLVFEKNGARVTRKFIKQ
ncbi:MAG: T9SS type A sorting domain-containing protein, partial [Saprospiraceae bacterium]|nr:T9SS type A sorting domain-containing protein [Saprospiraceae bacterium]